MTLGESEVRNRFPGVSKAGKKWRARVRHPKLKFDVNLGCFLTPEAAAHVIRKKKAEFEEMFKGENSMNVETCRDDFEGKKLPIGESEVRTRFPGVSKAGKKWRARVRHPKLKFDVNLGCYLTPEVAAHVIRKKKAEFEETLKGENSMNVETCRGDFEGKKLPLGVYRGYGTWDARIWHPKLKYLVSLGSFSSPEDAAIAFNSKRTEYLKMYCWDNRKDNDNVLEQPKCEVITTSEISNRPDSRPSFETNEGPMKIECADDSNNIAELECKFVRCSGTSVIEPNNSNSVDIGNEHKSGCGLDFEEAMSSEFINEYGQLVGEYSELDEQMGFSLPDDCDEVVADVG